MTETKEKFTIEITDHGAVTISGEGKRLHFSPGEALMLLDILRHEEPHLKKMAEEASPLPIRIKT